jgi:hypothetical protein
MIDRNIHICNKIAKFCKKEQSGKYPDTFDRLRRKEYVCKISRGIQKEAYFD